MSETILYDNYLKCLYPLFLKKLNCGIIILTISQNSEETPKGRKRDLQENRPPQSAYSFILTQYINLSIGLLADKNVDKYCKNGLNKPFFIT